MTTTNDQVLLSPSGVQELVDEGESSKITAFFKDNDDEVLPGAPVQSIRLTLEVADTGAIVNGRDNVDVLGVGGGALALDGEFTLKLSGEDNLIVGEGNEDHRAIIEWSWSDQEGLVQIGFVKWLFTVVPVMVPTTGPPPPDAPPADSPWLG